MSRTRGGCLVWLVCASVQGLPACAEDAREYSEAPVGSDAGPTVTASETGSTATSAQATQTTANATESTDLDTSSVNPDGQTSDVTPVEPDVSDTTGDSLDSTTDGETDVNEDSSGVQDTTATSSSDDESSEQAPVSGAVHGRLIDFWGHGVPGVEVVVGEQSGTTNDEGEFVVEDVAATYDVSFVLFMEDTQGSFGYQFVHLSRRDPVLQVFEAWPPLTATLTATASGVTLDDDVDVVGVSFGSDDGNFASWLADTGKELMPVWSGAEETLAGVHAIHWHEDDSVPTEYLGYFSDTVALTSGDRTTLDVMLGGEPLDMSTINGTVTGTTSNDRVNSVYVTFDDGAAIEVVEDSNTEQDDFSYLTPTIGGATLVFAASESVGDGDSAAIVYKRGVAPGESDLAMRIPTPASLEQPADGATLTADSEFEWTLPSGDNQVVVVRIEDTGMWGGMYIITDQPSARLPTFATYSLRTQATHEWRVETHRACASIDECAGADGFWIPSAQHGRGSARSNATAATLRRYEVCSSPSRHCEEPHDSRALTRGSLALLP